MLNGRRQPSRGGTSRMTRECQVRFCERLGVKFPGPTRLGCAKTKSDLVVMPSGRPAPDALGMSASLRSRPNLRTAAIRRGVPIPVVSRCSENSLLDQLAGAVAQGGWYSGFSPLKRRAVQITLSVTWER